MHECMFPQQGPPGLQVGSFTWSPLQLAPFHAVLVLQDILHTFANHPWLEEPDGQAAVKRVLAAYSVHNPEVGYCRSMNHIVALLLVALNRYAQLNSC